jgi:hypothetical protein
MMLLHTRTIIGIILLLNTFGITTGIVWSYMSYNLYGDVTLSSFNGTYCHCNNYISNIHLGYLVGF